ncbi:MAG: Type I restriction modification DNA specificity domain protein [Parcubacteria group bacterium GW2011_GWF2_38_76]|nr:MAG: Type I restriction modification DNA specificity domain protein [Parcubacteria group bacterium GW2011_GWF2_38_76]HBM46189.1 restriction endonuclease subunit S [Patescibacteria group bacterium]
MTISQNTIPKGWSVKQIGDLLNFERPDNYIVESESYNQKNNIPVLTANKSFILGYTNEDFGIYKNIPAIIFDDFTTDSKFVDFPFKVKSSAIKILKSKEENYDLRFVYELMKSINFQIANHKRHYISQYQYLEVKMPPIAEQKKIAEILSTVDEEIHKTSEIIAQTENLKNGISKHLFTRGVGHDKFQKTKIGDIPKEWNFLKMKDICTVSQGLQIPISKRFKDPGENRYKYITLKNIKEDTYEYIESPKESVICKKDDVLMTRTGNTGVVVTDVEGVFHNNFFLIDFDRKRIDRNYLVYYLRGEPIKKLLLERAGTTTIPDLNHGAFYGIHFLLPDLTEQRKISDILSSIDNKILFNKEMRAKLTDLKKGLMQDLLSGNKRVKV